MCSINLLLIHGHEYMRHYMPCLYPPTLNSLCPYLFCLTFLCVHEYLLVEHAYQPLWSLGWYMCCLTECSPNWPCWRICHCLDMSIDLRINQLKVYIPIWAHGFHWSFYIFTCAPGYCPFHMHNIDSHSSSSPTHSHASVLIFFICFLWVGYGIFFMFEYGIILCSSDFNWFALRHWIVIRQVL